MGLEYNRYSTMPSRLLFTHGFLPDKGKNTWSKRSNTLLAIAGINKAYPILHMEICRISEKGKRKVIREENIDLMVADEMKVQRVIEAFGVE